MLTGANCANKMEDATKKTKALRTL